MKILAIDGNSIVNRAFYGVKLLSTKDGRFTNAIYGFINILLKLCEDEKPDSVVVAFDLKKPTFRHKMYTEYKAGRKGMPDELAEQMPLVKEWLRLAGYKTLECEGYEADDILGTLCSIADESGNTCVVATGDRDSLQLISDNSRVLLAATKMGRPEVISYDKQTLFEKYGLTPSQMIDLKSLMGDSSDNIPGVAGIGEKTATALITQFGSLDGVYENIDSPNIKQSVKIKLENGKESAYLSRDLGTIFREVPISRNPDEYKKSKRNDTELARFMTDLELFKLMERLGIKATAAPAAEPEKIEEIKSISSKEFFKNTPQSICVFYDGGLFAAVCDGKSVCEISSSELDGIMSNPDISKSVYNSKSYYLEALSSGKNAENIAFDAMLAGYLASPSASSYEPERLAAEYSVSFYQSYDFTPSEQSAVMLWAVCEKLKEILVRDGLIGLFEKIEMPLSNVLAEMEHTGFLIDTAGIAEMGAELEIRISDIKKEIFSLTGYEFNLNSPKQLGEALFEKLNLPGGKKTKTGYSTNAEVLEKLKDEHPAVALLLQYRQLSKLKSTYCDGLTLAADSEGKIHSTFNQVETRTGRISSTEPNLQNIPVRTEEGRRLRKYFKAHDGYVLCDADYSQIELRVLAHIANDTAMIKAFKDGTDIHTLTASEVFNMPIDMVTPLMRSRAKAVNFGIVYGIGAFSLAKDIGVSRAEADSYIKGYLSTYTGVDHYMKNVIEQAKKNGFVSTFFGRRRYLPELSSSNGMMRAFGERVARNMPIQGAAADIIKIAMIRVKNRLLEENLDARLILQVHDELIVEAKEEIKDTVCSILTEEMEKSAEMSVRLIADVGSGKTWYDAKE